VYADLDGDGYGLSAIPIEACGVSEGLAALSGDCDETDAAVHPGADEVCDGIDNDCSGLSDDGLVTDTYYADPDGDGYGLTAVAVESCTVPAGYVTLGGDCSEGDAGINPGAAEVCDGVDNDCSGSVDEGLTTVFYADTDGDGVGVDSDTAEACSVPDGYSTSPGDCEPDDGSVFPGASEVCDGVDNDCDDLVDDADAGLDLATATAFYADLDDDTFGAGDAVYACEEPVGHTTDNTDCLDFDSVVHPGAPESWYDGIDQDCGGDSDFDADGDGYDSEDYGGIDSDDSDASCVTDCVTDGLTEDAPADSCVAIFDDNPDALNGWYWIDPAGPPMEVFCDIENGGWMQCFEMVNTGEVDLGTENNWLDDCIDFSTASWTSNELRVTLTDESGSDLYDATGLRLHDWNYNQITSTTETSSQYQSDNHERLVALSTGDKLMMAGRNSTNSGCGGSFGNGYSVVIYPEEPDYHSNVKMLVVPHRHADGSERGFSGWTPSHEISYAPDTMATCSSTVSQLGTFAFWLR
jgi:hypothetical protein